MADIDESMPTTPPRGWQAGDGGYGESRRGSHHGGGGARPEAGGSAQDTVSLHGIDPASLTPEVQALINNLMAEVDALRWRLTQAERRQSFLEGQADQDAWLPVLNRRAFLRRLGAFLERTESEGLAGVVALIYLDNFHEVRQADGLSVAQKALRDLTRQVVASLRASDLVGFVGGAGIAVLMTTAHADGARAKVDSVVAGIATQPFAADGRRLSLRPVAVLHALEAGDTADSVLADLEDHLRRSG